MPGFFEKTSPLAPRTPRTVNGYLWAIGGVALATGAMVLARGYLDTEIASLLYLPVAIACAVRFGFGPSVLASLLSYLSWDFFFTPPIYKFNVVSTHDWFTFTSFLVTATTSAYLASEARSRANAAKAKQDELQNLNAELERRVAQRTSELSNTVSALNVEIAQRRRAEIVARGQIEAMTRVTGDIHAGSDLNLFLGNVLHQIVEQLDEEEGDFWLYDGDARILTRHVGYSRGKASEPAGESRSIPAGPGFDADTRILSSVQAISLDPLTDPCGQPPFLRHYCERGTRTLLSVPMFAGSQLLGLAAIGSLRSREFEPAELELALALSHLATLAIQLTRLAAEAQNTGQEAAVLEERNRIAQDIHDTLAHSLTGVKFLLEAAGTLTDEAQKAECLQRARQMAIDCAQEARRCVWAFRPASLDQAPDLISAIRIMAGRQTAGAGIDVAVTKTGRFGRFKPTVEENLLRIAQEALTNVVRHAEADRVTISLTATDHIVTLSIRDNGRGFVREDAERNHGFGTVSMADRAARIGASFRIVSEPGQFTEVTASMPAPEAEE